MGVFETPLREPTWQDVSQLIDDILSEAADPESDLVAIANRAISALGIVRQLLAEGPAPSGASLYYPGNRRPRAASGRALARRADGTIEPWPAEARSRIYSLIEKQPGDGHWLWQGRTVSGYPVTGIGSASRTVMAAHAVWEIESGRLLPPRARLSAICGERLCVRPEHRALSLPSGRKVSFTEFSAAASAAHTPAPPTESVSAEDHDGETALARIANAAARAAAGLYTEPRASDPLAADDDDDFSFLDSLR